MAVMDGDYDEGKTKIETARKFMGEENFKLFRTEQPERYQDLLEMTERSAK